MEGPTRTIEQIREELTIAGDSIWVIEDSIQKLTDGAVATTELKNSIQRNVDHLKIVVAKEDVVTSGEDTSTLSAAIATGEAKLAENIWPAE